MRTLFIFLIFSIELVSAQEYKFLVQLKDKNNSGFSVSQPSAFLSGKAIQRRKKQNIPIDQTDLPVTEAYIDSLSAIQFLRVQNRSRWFNQVLISVPDTSILQKVRQFSFVTSSQPVNNRQLKKIPYRYSINQVRASSGRAGLENTGSVSGIISPSQYGASFSQIHTHHGEFLHNLGFQGEGKTIAILDDGFNNYLYNPAFDSLRNNHRILGTYDFVHQKTSVNEEANHGALCFSIVASNLPGTLIGTARAASYWLFKTEDDSSETPVEEQNWVAAAEFADSVGADLITTSLGYGYFDDPKYNLTYGERDGHTSLISRAANLAVAKGMIVTASAGNSGIDSLETKFVSCPADGDSVYAVGAIDFFGRIAGFSSWGPNGSGQVKPDGVSIGLNTFLIAPDGNSYTGSGTSFSNPNLAGLITCLWQAFPEFNAHDILSAVRQSSDLYANPDGRFGYGIPDFEKAYQILLLKKIDGIRPLTASDWLHVFPIPFHESFEIFVLPAATGTADIQLLDVGGKLIQSETLQIKAGLSLRVTIRLRISVSAGGYFVRYTDSKNTKTIKVLKD